MRTAALLTASLLYFAVGTALAAEPSLPGLDALLPGLEQLYIDLHQNPELSLQEAKTAAKLVAHLRELPLEVYEGVGGHGIVAILRNGEGSTVLVRTDLDALPIEEQTGRSYASQVRARNAAGEEVPVMHACGHDVHMCSWLGAATLLAQSQKQWRGTVVFVGQPAEEVLQGAQLMIDAGLFTKFPKPDFVLGLHVTHLIAAGQLGIIAGPASAASNAVDITFYGKGGHGAMPHMTVDPIVMASRAVVALQGIVSREIDPQQAAVITVGSFHAGSKRNIIPDEAKLQLTVRSYDSDVQQQLVRAIERIAKAEAAVSGAPREPLVVVDALEASEVVINDPQLAARLRAALEQHFGAAQVVSMKPATTSEDFGVFGRVAAAPSVQLRLGATKAALLERSRKAGELPPGMHNGNFAPDVVPTLRSGVAALTVCVWDLLQRPVAP